MEGGLRFFILIIEMVCCGGRGGPYRSTGLSSTPPLLCLMWMRMGETTCS